MSKAKALVKPRRNIIEQNVIFVWIALATATVLLLPLISMLFNTGAYWTAVDFVTGAVLLFGLSSAFVLVARKVSRQRRLIVGLAFVAVFFYIWAELAVGVFTR